MVVDAADVVDDDDFELPLPGTPPQMFATNADESAAMDKMDAKRARSQAKEAGIQAAKEKRASKKEISQENDPFGDAVKAMVKSSKEAQALTDAETAARKAFKEPQDDDTDEKARLRRALRT